MAKRIWYLFLAIVVVMVGGYMLYSSQDNVKDGRVWSQFRKELTPENVVKIEFGVDKPMTIAEADRAEVLSLLKAATFDHSNREGHGPTPGAVLSLTLKDGKQVHLGMLSFASFELGPRHLDPNTQFLIKAEPLGVWLRNHFQSPSVG